MSTPAEPRAPSGATASARAAYRPLADRMRPQDIREFVGQQHLVGQGGPLRRALDIAGLLAAGVTFFLNDDQAVNRLEQKVQQLRDQLPDNINVPQP